MNFRWEFDEYRYVLIDGGRVLAGTEFGGDETPYYYAQKGRGDVVMLHAYKGKPIEERKLMLEALVAIEYGD